MNDELPSDYPSHDPLREEAALWFARMRGEEAAEHRAAFERWLGQGALHRAAYNRIGAVFAAGKSLRPEFRARVPTIGRWSAVVAAIAALVLACTAILVVTTRSSPVNVNAGPKHLDDVVASSAAKVRSIRLPQGGAAILDTDAKLDTDIAGTGRWMRLERGRIRLTVDPSRSPRTVLAGTFAVRSTGGTFDLWLRPDASLDARILEGRVQIRPAVLFVAAGKTASLDLTSGQHYRLRANGNGYAVPPTSGLDWPQGVLEYRGALLDDIVEEANRYSATKIVLANQPLGRERISGRFGINDPKLLAMRLAAALTLVLDRTQPGLLILRREKNISSAP